MDELIAEWAEHLLVIRGRAQGTVAKYSGVVRQALEAMGVERPEEIGAEGLERYLRGQYVAGRSESTRALIVTALRELCAWLALREVIGANPLARFPRPKVYRAEAHRLTPAEVERLIFGGGRRTLPRDPLAARNRTLVGVMYICGLRASEPGRLRVEDLRWLEEERAFSVLIRGAKWQDQDVRRATDEEVGRMLGAYLEGPRAELLRLEGDAPWVFPGARGGPLTRSGVARAFGLLLEHEGIEARGRRLSPHILRHSIATHMLQAGSNLRLVQEWMRHASVETTQIYTDPEVGRIHREWRKRHPLKAAARKARVPSMHRAVSGFLRELQE